MQRAEMDSKVMLNIHEKKIMKEDNFDTNNVFIRKIYSSFHIPRHRI